MYGYLVVTHHYELEEYLILLLCTYSVNFHKINATFSVVVTDIVFKTRNEIPHDITNTRRKH